MPKKLAIVGSREFQNEELVRETVRRLAARDPDLIIVSGGARGVDRWAADEARKCGLKVEEYLPDWDRDGRAAGFIRNGLIVRAANSVLGFWDGVSHGTLNSLNQARTQKKKVRAISSDGLELEF